MPRRETTIIDIERGQRITEARELKGLLQKDLAELLNKTPQAISKYEKGHPMTLDVLTLLCEFVDASADYILRGKKVVDNLSNSSLVLTKSPEMEKKDNYILILEDKIKILQRECIYLRDENEKLKKKSG